MVKITYKLYLAYIKWWYNIWRNIFKKNYGLIVGKGYEEVNTSNWPWHQKLIGGITNKSKVLFCWHVDHYYHLYKEWRW